MWGLQSNYTPCDLPKAYPLPTPEEMFSALANRESFIRLDLMQAYLNGHCLKTAVLGTIAIHSKLYS